LFFNSCHGVTISEQRSRLSLVRQLLDPRKAKFRRRIYAQSVFPVVGSYTDTSNVTHGFTLTKKDVFTSFDPPGSTSTTPNFINPQGVIVGSYLDASTVSHGFILDRGKYTTVNFSGRGWNRSH
jgi:hypothetical protein